MTMANKRKIVAPFDITELERCPYCGSSNIEHISIKRWKGFYEINHNRICNYCYETWED